MNHSIYVISHIPERFPTIARSMYPQRVNYFDGSGFESFSKLINSCVAACPTEIVIIASYKVLPTNQDVLKLLDLINQGYAFVGLCNFRFFGFKKELFRRIGPLDERYLGGGFEDYDFCVRLAEANLAAYFTTEVVCNHAPSSWGDYSYGNKIWATKWRHTWQEGNRIPIELTRTWPEEKYNYDFGPSVPTEFIMPKDRSYLWPDLHVQPFFKMKIS